MYFMNGDLQGPGIKGGVLFIGHRLSPAKRKFLVCYAPLSSALFWLKLGWKSWMHSTSISWSNTILLGHWLAKIRVHDYKSELLPLPICSEHKEAATCCFGSTGYLQLAILWQGSSCSRNCQLGRKTVPKSPEPTVNFKFGERYRLAPEIDSISWTWILHPNCSWFNLITSFPAEILVDQFDTANETSKFSCLALLVSISKSDPAVGKEILALNLARWVRESSWFA